MPDPNIPAGFTPLDDPDPFLELVGPRRERADGVPGVRTEERHLNVAGSVMGGFLATFADAAFGRAIRHGADGEEVVRARAVFAVRGEDSSRRR